MWGLALDLQYSKDHNMTTRAGLRCWLDAMAESRFNAGIWFGTRCSSFVGLCRNNHGRSPANGYWGHRKKKFVKLGNLMMVVWGLCVYDVCDIYLAVSICKALL